VRKKKMSEINYSELESVIPLGEEVIYRTVCLGNIEATAQMGMKMQHKSATWNSPVLITSNGVAYTAPNIKKSKSVPEVKYIPWGEIFGFVGKGPRTGLMPVLFTYLILAKDESESKEDYENRKKEFIDKFQPLFIEKREKWLEINGSELRKRNFKMAQKFLSQVKGWEKKRK
jgi:hypothetical protein